jgi:hypothetical protein
VRAQTGLPLPDCCVILTAQAETNPATSVEVVVLTFDAKLRAGAERYGLRVG